MMFIISFLQGDTFHVPDNDPFAYIDFVLSRFFHASILLLVKRERERESEGEKQRKNSQLIVFVSFRSFLIYY